MNVAETSRRLFLHRNTVLQRLEQLGAALGPDWHTPPRSLNLHLALLSTARDDGGTRSHHPREAHPVVAPRSSAGPGSAPGSDSPEP